MTISIFRTRFTINVSVSSSLHKSTSNITHILSSSFCILRKNHVQYPLMRYSYDNFCNVQMLGPYQMYPMVQSRCMSSGFPFSFFWKLTSQKPEIRTKQYDEPSSSNTIPSSSNTIPSSSYRNPSSSNIIPRSSYTIPISSYRNPSTSNTIPSSSNTTSKNIDSSSYNIDSSSSAVNLSDKQRLRDIMHLREQQMPIREQIWYYVKGTKASIRRKYNLDYLNPTYRNNMKSIFNYSSSKNYKYIYKDGSVLKYTLAPWIPLTSIKSLIAGNPNLPDNYRILSSFFENKIPPLQSMKKNVGLSVVLDTQSSSLDTLCSRIKSVSLPYAIKYSFFYDLRFHLSILIIMGFAIWISLAPDPLLNQPGALCTPHLKDFIKTIDDAYVKHICSSHPNVHSPCDCGEPVNKVVRDLFPQTSFDPLQIDNKEIGKMKTVTIMVATIILSIALMESVSHFGVYTDV